MKCPEIFEDNTKIEKSSTEFSAESPTVISTAYKYSFHVGTFKKNTQKNNIKRINKENQYKEK